MTFQVSLFTTFYHHYHHHYHHAIHHHVPSFVTINTTITIINHHSPPTPTRTTITKFKWATHVEKGLESSTTVCWHVYRHCIKELLKIKFFIIYHNNLSLFVLLCMRAGIKVFCKSTAMHLGVQRSVIDITGNRVEALHVTSLQCIAL